MQRRIQRVALVLIYWPAGYLCDLPVMRARIFAPFLAPGQPKPCRNRAAAMLLRPLMPPTPKGCLRLMQRRIQRVALVLIYWPAGYLCDLPVRPLTPAWMGITPARARVGIMPVWAMVLVVGKVVSPVWSNSVYLGRRRRTCGPPTASQISASPYIGHRGSTTMGASGITATAGGATSTGGGASAARGGGRVV